MKRGEKRTQNPKKLTFGPADLKIYRPMHGELLQQWRSLAKANSVLVWDKKPIMDRVNTFKSTKI
jgi:hypothetical protein